MSRGAIAPTKHEMGLALFIAPPRRARFRSSLSDERRRIKLLATFGHFDELDSRFAVRLDGTADAASIFRLLTKKGAPSICYLVSEEAELDRRFFDLGEALDRVVNGFAGTFVSCLPGRLAFFTDEEAQYILERAA